MQQIRDHIIKGEDPAGLAATYSECGSAQQGGDLGHFGPGQMQPAFEQTAFSLNVGELSNMIETESGIHIVWRTD